MHRVHSLQGDAPIQLCKILALTHEALASAQNTLVENDLIGAQTSQHLAGHLIQQIRVQRII